MRTIILALMLGISSPALAAPADTLKMVIDDHWAWFLKNSPVYATTLGVRNYDDQIGDISLAAQDKQAAEAQAFVNRLRAIPDASLSPEDRTNKGVLSRILTEQVDGNRFGQRMMLF